MFKTTYTTIGYATVFGATEDTVITEALLRDVYTRLREGIVSREEAEILGGLRPRSDAKIIDAEYVVGEDEAERLALPEGR